MAQKLGWHLLDSGAIYRAFALAVKTQNAAIEDEKSLLRIAQNLDLSFKTQADNELVSVYLNQQEISAELRLETTGELASKLAAIKVVRAALLQRQRDFAHTPGLVADGRDMGTVVFARATYKVFLTASAEQRAIRRFKQLRNQGVKGIISQLLAEVVKRDARDSSRKHSPLVPAETALVIDTTTLSIEAVVAKVSALFEDFNGSPFL